jgi:hypothetical protein
VVTVDDWSVDRFSLFTALLRQESCASGQPVVEEAK